MITQPNDFVMSTNRGGMLYRCPEIEDLDLTLEATQCGHEPAPFCTLADYLGVGTGVLEACVVINLLPPILLWRKVGETNA